MKIILTIGYIDILLPDESGVSTILKTLAKGVRVRDRLYEGKVEIERESIALEMKVVPKTAKFVDEEDRPTNATKVKALPGPTLLLE